MSMEVKLIVFSLLMLSVGCFMFYPINVSSILVISNKKFYVSPLSGLVHEEKQFCQEVESLCSDPSGSEGVLCQVLGCSVFLVVDFPDLSCATAMDSKLKRKGSYRY